MLKIITFIITILTKNTARILIASHLDMLVEHIQQFFDINSPLCTVRFRKSLNFS